jgi:hypothetical protein
LEKFLKNKMTKDKVNSSFKKDFKRAQTIKWNLKSVFV